MTTFLERCFRQPYRKTCEPEYTRRLCSSWILPSPILFIFRALVSLYGFLVLFLVLGLRIHGQNRAGTARRSFSYFTVLGYWGLAFYYAFAAAHTASYCLRAKQKAWLESWPRPLRWLHSAFYSTITVYPFVVTAVFWAVLDDGAFETTFKTWTNVSQHALNSVFAFLEIILPRSEPFPWLNLIPVIVVLACYLGLAYVTHATQGFYVYPFLDPENGQGFVAGICIAILVACIIVFAIVKYLIKLRLWLTEDKLSRRCDFSNKGEEGLIMTHTHEAEEMREVPKRSDV
ncbi:hypothetical protein K431DRAFT_275786 [Polychaeton citri CBS 116435]|uniref:FAR-17a/AIG1-like protein n=1 Tax=Polychaeton citri CBS 116435 TaxID=1314669 RepID=A0A9P4Q1D3_9PEZI|nr:hypothetical protein K431DRAFT_275786 [Polychaeton citri CBS 116435]